MPFHSFHYALLLKTRYLFRRTNKKKAPFWVCFVVVVVVVVVVVDVGDVAVVSLTSLLVVSLFFIWGFEPHRIVLPSALMTFSTRSSPSNEYNPL